MTLTTLLLMIGSVAVVLTLITGLVFRKHKSWILTFAQNFCGALFIFSGWVKAVDPLGTAYKMQDYFTEFQYTFEGTWLSFLSPIFPFLSEHSIAFSVFMIVLEIVLGVMLIIGYKPKLTSWLFLLIVAFFTMLTGYTYLTGYVPSGANFFSFSEWGNYNANNMRVQDCGCFGDFIKLEPKVSFFKDVFLLIPAIIFVFRYKDFHQFFTPRVRGIIVALVALGTFVYCLSNYVWDIPSNDFRPFKKGADIKNLRAAELKAMGDVAIIGWQFENENTGEIVDYMGDYASGAAEYSKEKGWKVKDQLKTEPKIKKTKLSDFDIASFGGDDVSEEILEYSGRSIMIVCHKLKGTAEEKVRTVQDSIFIMDTIPVQETDSVAIIKRFDRVESYEESYTDYTWDDDFADAFESRVVPFCDAASEAGYKILFAIGGADENAVEDLQLDFQFSYDVYSADDLLLKTIVRSNPGIVLWEDGKILDKWHYKQLPNFDEIAK